MAASISQNGDPLGRRPFGSLEESSLSGSSMLLNSIASFEDCFLVDSA